MAGALLCAVLVRSERPGRSGTRRCAAPPPGSGAVRTARPVAVRSAAKSAGGRWRSSRARAHSQPANVPTSRVWSCSMREWRTSGGTSASWRRRRRLSSRTLLAAGWSASTSAASVSQRARARKRPYQPGVADRVDERRDQGLHQRGTGPRPGRRARRRALASSAVPLFVDGRHAGVEDGGDQPGPVAEVVLGGGVVALAGGGLTSRSETASMPRSANSCSAARMMACRAAPRGAIGETLSHLT